MHWNDFGYPAVANCGGPSASGALNCSDPGSNDANHIYVGTLNTSGATANLGFYIVVGAP